MRVRNVNGTSGLNCGCGSWFKHWEKFSGQPTPPSCREVICRNAAEVGAHVQAESLSDSKWYIVPLCNAHNKAAQTLEIMNGTSLVPANVIETCAKSLGWMYKAARV